MKLNSFICGALTTTMLVVVASLIYHGCDRTSSVIETEDVTESVTDTIPHVIENPEPKDSVILRYVTVKIPVNDTIQEIAVDTLIDNDSVAIEIPITQKTYQDSTYQAWVSGYMPALDSIRIYQPVTTITHTITNTEIKYKTNRWGLGLQVGMGVTPSKIEPYIGIGITYNIFSW